MRSALKRLALRVQRESKQKNRAVKKKRGLGGKKSCSVIWIDKVAFTDTQRRRKKSSNKKGETGCCGAKASFVFAHAHLSLTVFSAFHLGWLIHLVESRTVEHAHAHIFLKHFLPPFLFVFSQSAQAAATGHMQNWGQGILRKRSRVSFQRQMKRKRKKALCGLN